MKRKNGWKLGQSGNPNGRPKGLGRFVNQRDNRLFLKFGIRLSEYFKILEMQNGVCAICGKEEVKTQRRGFSDKKNLDSLHVDHNHDTGEIRGLLCYRCNTAIGKLYDDPELLRRAADYLEGNRIKIPENIQKRVRDRYNMQLEMFGESGASDESPV